MSTRGRTLALFGLLALLSVPALYPYLGGDLPRTNDLATHIYRAFELEQLVRAGTLFPHWGPHLVHGYGYPIFNYFAYLSHYLITLIHFTGIDYLWAYRLAAIAVTLAAGWGTFLLGRDLTGGSERAGLLAAAGYVYSPYLLYTAHARGGLPESLALAALPFVLWTWRSAALGQRPFIAWGGIAYATLIFSHNGIALQTSPLALAFALWAGRANWRRAVVHIAATSILGLLLSAFYWLPALSELSFAQIESGFAATGIAYFHNFTPLAELFAYPPLPVDSDLLNPPVLRPVAIATLSLAVLALLTAWRTKQPNRADLYFLGALLASCLFIVLPQSRFVWDAIPLLQRTLWPWRYLGPAALFAALLASALPLSRITHHASRFTYHVSRIAYLQLPISLLIIPLFILNALPWLYPPRETITPPETIADLARYELPPFLIGTSSTAEYLPLWVSALPDTTEQRDRLLSDPDPDRLERATLPPQAEITHVRNKLLRDEYLISNTNSLTLTFQHFYFPGWQALLDGAPLPIRITSPHGLIALDIPAGEHTLELRFGSTPVRTLAAIFSLAALATTLGLLATFYPKGTSHVSPLRLRSELALSLSKGQGFTFHEAKLPITNYQYPISLLIVSLFIASLFIDSPIRQHGLASGNQPTAMQHTLNADISGELWLHGYTIRKAAIPADGETELDLYWQAQHPLGLDYGFNLRLTDAQGRIWNSPETVRPADWRFIPGTDFWPPDQYILDSYVLRPLPGAPPGEYQIEVVTFRNDTLEALDTAVLGPLTITAPDTSSYTGAVPRAELVDGKLALLDLTIDRTEAAPGDPVRVDVVWQALGDVELRTDYGLQLALYTLEEQLADGRPAAAFEFLIGSSYPTSHWQRGDILHDQDIFRLPATLPPGLYEWRLLITRPDGAVVDEYRPRPPATLHIAALDRQFTLPSLDARLDITLSAQSAPSADQITLIGYDLAAESYHPGDDLTLTLVWQTQSEITVPYRVFVHLLDADGQLVAQSDAEPANWARPTTGWAPGEYVPDIHTISLPFDLPAGAYTLTAGLYEPGTGQRLVSSLYPEGKIQIGLVEITP